MHRPVLVSPPELLPVSLAEAKLHLRVDHNDDDALIEGLVRAATEHLDGWTGILGRCLVEQTWRQDFDSFASCLPLPLGPVICVQSVTWRDSAGQISTVASSNYGLRTDAGGRAVVRFAADFAFPSDLHDSRAVAVTYKAGYAVSGEGDAQTAAVPQPLKVAILLTVAHLYEHREAVSADQLAELPFGAMALIAPWRRVGV